MTSFNTTPVLLLLFNRPDHTRKLLDRLRECRPSVLFINADGPRKGHPTDAQRCAQVRSLISEIDWPCEIHSRLLDDNLGCRHAVKSGIDWFFNQVEEGIILEDDCLPHPDFFLFCQTMLAQYRYSHPVMHISGFNPLGEITGNATHTYFFSRFSLVWGWATWRRAWLQYRDDFSDLDNQYFDPTSPLRALAPGTGAGRYLHDKFTRVREGSIVTWDYPWFYSVMSAGGYSIIPRKNLVENIGIGAEATHTRRRFRSRMPKTVKLDSQWSHPASFRLNPSLEALLFRKTQKEGPGLWLRQILPWAFYRPLPKRYPGYFSNLLQRAANLIVGAEV